jgi:hypothetical protein
MPLKSMRLPAEGTLLGGPEVVQHRPDYPYGLRLNLDEDSLKLLNMGELPKVGKVMMLHARVVVESAGEQEMQGSGKKRNLGLQITEMELEGGSDSDERDHAAVIYTEDN